MSLLPQTQREDSSRPVVLLLYFLRDNYLETTERRLYESLRNNAALLEARDAQAALQHLAITPPPQAVLVADANVTEAANAPLLDALVEYARGGGRVIFGVRFSAHFPYFDVSHFFRRFGMLWDPGRLSNATFYLNSTGLPQPLSGDNLSPTFTTRAQQVKDIGTEAAVYLLTQEPASEASTLSVDVKKEKPLQETQFPAAFAPLALGHVGYVGTVNGGPKATQLLLEMCGVTVTSAKIGPETSRGAYNHPDDLNFEGPELLHRKTNLIGFPLPSEGAPQLNAEPGPSGTTQTEPSVKAPSKVLPTVIILQLAHSPVPLRRTHTQLVKGLEKNSVLRMVANGAKLLRHLCTSPPPQAVLVADNVICQPAHAEVLTKLIAYARSGGRVVLGACFCLNLDYAHLTPFFRRWSVPWDVSFPDPIEKTYALNPTGVPAPLSSAALFPMFVAATHLFSTSRPEHVVYGRLTPRARDQSRGPLYDIALDTFAAGWAPVGQGFLGFVGDVDWEQALTRMTIEMCGVAVAPGDLGARSLEFEIPVPPPELEIPLPSPNRPREVEVMFRARRRAETRENRMKIGEQHKNEGNVKFRAGDYLGAALCYRNAAKQDSPRPVYMANLAAALLKLERWDLAQSAAGRALYHDPKNKKARFRRAMARKHLKRYYGAKLDLQKFMYLDMTKMNEEGFREFQILDELQAQGDEVEWPLNAGEGEADEEEEWVEVEELLDPEEYKRASDAGPCREYNHEGCSKGDECPRGHTPMEVITTRDELGRNVCMYWLLDTCEKGDACEYAHDKTYLPPSGWWTDEKRQGRIREHIGRMVALAGRPYPGVRLLMDLNPKPWLYEPWALYPYAPTTEERQAWERRRNWPPKSYIWDEMSYYEIDPSDPNAIDQLESRRRTYDNA